MLVSIVLISWVVVLFDDYMDRNSLIQSKIQYENQMKLIRARIEWCHKQKGIAIVEADKYQMIFKSCTLPPN